MRDGQCTEPEMSLPEIGPPSSNDGQPTFKSNYPENPENGFKTRQK